MSHVLFFILASLKKLFCGRRREGEGRNPFFYFVMFITVEGRESGQNGCFSLSHTPELATDPTKKTYVTLTLDTKNCLACQIIIALFFSLQ